MNQDLSRFSLASRRLYLCTPDRLDIERFVSSCIEGGVDIVQLREKSLEAKELISRAQIVKAVCAAYAVPFIVNDRPDIAQYVQADGVHVGQDDVPASLARQLLGPEHIVGLSTHATADLEGARHEPVDYLSAGPIVETPTKPGRRGTGIAYIEEATRTASSWDTPSGQGIPIFVTGGITPETIPAIVQSGGRHFVVVRYLTESGDPSKAAKRLREAIDRSLDEVGEAQNPDEPESG